MVQRAMGGPELSIDCLGDREGRCLNAIPRTMLESRGGESIKGTVIARRGADRARAARGGGAAGARARRRSRCSATPRSASASPTSTRASAAPSRRPSTRRCPGRTYPELIVRDGRRRDASSRTSASSAPGCTFTRYYWQLELDEQLRADGPRHRARRPAAAALSAPRSACTRCTGGGLESGAVATSLVDSPPPQDRSPQDAGAAPAPSPRRAAGPRRRRRGPAAAPPCAQLRRADGARAGLVPAVRRRRARQRRRARGWRPWRDRARGDGGAACSARPRPAMRRSARSRSTPRVKIATVAQAPPPARRRPARRPRPTPTPPPDAERSRSTATTAEDPADRRHAAGDARPSTPATTDERHDAEQKTSTTGERRLAAPNETSRTRSCSTPTRPPPTTPTPTRRRGFGDPSLTIDGDTTHRLERAGQPGDRAEDGRGRADRPEVAPEALGREARHDHARA